MKAFAAAVLLAATLAGCSEPTGMEEVDGGTCPPREMAQFHIEAEGRPLRHAYLVAGVQYRPALSCMGHEPYADLPAVDGVVVGKAGLQAYEEIRLFFNDGTLRLGLDLPTAPFHNLTVRLGPPPTVTDDGAAVAVARSEWLGGPEAGRDLRYGDGTGLVPLETRNETMAITVESAWNRRLLASAIVSYGPPYSPELVEDAGGRVRITVLTPSGAVHASEEARDPHGSVGIDVGPGVEPGVWQVRFEHTASARTDPPMKSSVNVYLFY